MINYGVLHAFHAGGLSSGIYLLILIDQTENILHIAKAMLMDLFEHYKTNIRLWVAMYCFLTTLAHIFIMHTMLCIIFDYIMNN